MFSKILIANRGEIAVRIIRACRDMGITSVAVYSTADREALHTQLADEAICIGGPRAKDSYLNIRNLLGAAEASGAEAIHPGFGFLSENPDFAKACEDCGIAVIGPSSKLRRGGGRVPRGGADRSGNRLPGDAQSRLRRGRQGHPQGG